MDNFQTYIQQSVSLIKTVKTGAKLVKSVTLDPSALLTSLLNSYMKPVFDIMKQVHNYIP
jgi:hypothetical protein